MIHKYKIESILHSGTKSERGTPVTDEKYDHLVGSIVKFEPDNVKDGESLTFWFDWHPFYRWWTVSTIISHEFREDGRVLVIETLNSIYTFIDCGEYAFQRSKAVRVELACV